MYKAACFLFSLEDHAFSRATRTRRAEGGRNPASIQAESKAL
jgi:hypothetical protein